MTAGLFVPGSLPRFHSLTSCSPLSILILTESAHVVIVCRNGGRLPGPETSRLNSGGPAMTSVSCRCESRFVGTKQSQWGCQGMRLPRFARNDKRVDGLQFCNSGTPYQSSLLQIRHYFPRPLKSLNSLIKPQAIFKLHRVMCRLLLFQPKTSYNDNEIVNLRKLILLIAPVVPAIILASLREPRHA